MRKLILALTLLASMSSFADWTGEAALSKALNTSTFYEPSVISFLLVRNNYCSRSQHIRAQTLKAIKQYESCLFEGEYQEESEWSLIDFDEKEKKEWFASCKAELDNLNKVYQILDFPYLLEGFYKDQYFLLLYIDDEDNSICEPF